MPESVPMRCPVCRRAHRYTVPSYPCVCGAPVAPRLDREGGPTPVPERVWQEEWVIVRCGACGHRGEWPRPELGCPCGTALRIPVADADGTAAATGPPGTDRAAGTPGSARDAVTAATRYLRRLGHEDVRPADRPPPAGVALTGRGVVALVAPPERPVTLRDVECLWLTAMTESARCLCLSRAGYTEDARDRAGTLGVPLFVLGPADGALALNAPARALAARLAPGAVDDGGGAR
ncbi:hypothetical protein ACFYOV_09645 [Streptomyces sp. NPDC005931]|uniref:hypothetical protein n=1 Tax=Streptomyces sp. NPDC005931 TaxID=3364737 RepID=UPI003697BDDA